MSSEELRRLGERLRDARRILQQHLEQDALGESAGDPRPLSKTIRGAEELIGASVLDLGENEIARVELIAKHVAELATARPDVLNALRRKLLSLDVGDYYGGRYEAVVAAALTRQRVPYRFELREAPDFAVDVDNTPVGIECTSGRLETLADPDPFFKIADAIDAKSTKPYASRRVAIAIDVTILFARSLAAGASLLSDSLESRLTTTLGGTKFGAVIATAHVLDDRERPRHFQAVTRRVNHPDIDKALASFLDYAFPINNQRIPLAWVSHLT